MSEAVSEEQLDELINGTGYDYLHQKLAGEVRAARAREAEAYGAGFEQCRRRAVAAEAEVERLQQRIDKALDLHKQAYAGKVDDGSDHFVCEVCEEVSYPCSTVTALAGTGDGK